MFHVSTKKLKGAYQTLLVTFLTLLMFHLSLAVGPLLERKFFPVMINGQILDVEEQPNGMSQITFSAEKVRPCTWFQTTWWIGHLGGLSAQVVARHESPPQVRSEGLHIWKNLWVGLSEKLLRTSSYSITYHDCHPFWRSQSIFFNSEWLVPPSN